MKLKPSIFFRFFFLLNLCFFGLSCRHDILVQPVGAETESSTTVSSATNNNDCSNPLTAVVVARRGDRQLSEYYQMIFRDNPRVQTILFDRRNNFYFGVTVRIQSDGIKQDCTCSTGSFKMNTVLVEIKQPVTIINTRTIQTPIADIWARICGRP
jgi:hypothetical protein